jgi:zinc protease
VVSMIGAVTRAEAEAIAERLTSGLPAGEAPPPLPEVVAPPSAERRIPHPATQSHILVGAPAMARGDPDFFPLFVGNYVLGGGGFVSRLTSEVRDKRGLAYSVYAYFAPMAQPGPFAVGLQTQKAQTDEALKVVRETVERFVREGPTEAELTAAKQNLVGGFALRIDSNRKILDNLSTIGWYRLPLDYLERWTDQVERVTAVQIREAFQRKVRPAELVTVVVGAGETRP